MRMPDAVIAGAAQPSVANMDFLHDLQPSSHTNTTQPLPRAEKWFLAPWKEFFC
jgi:hypothetical protein